MRAWRRTGIVRVRRIAQIESLLARQRCQVARIRPLLARGDATSIRRGSKFARCHGEVPSFRCYWCQRVLPIRLRTRDHLIPRCRGGTGLPGNIRIACYGCNQSRGHVTGFWGRLEALRWRLFCWARLDHADRAAIRRELHEARGQQAWHLKLKRRWVALELIRENRSPTRELDLTIPCVPNGD